VTAPDRAATAPGAVTSDLHTILERLAGRVGDVPPAYRQHVLVIIQTLEALLDEMVDR